MVYNFFDFKKIKRGRHKMFFFVLVHEGELWFVYRLQSLDTANVGNPFTESKHKISESVTLNCLNTVEDAA